MASTWISGSSLSLYFVGEDGGNSTVSFSGEILAVFCFSSLFVSCIELEPGLAPGTTNLKGLSFTN